MSSDCSIEDNKAEELHRIQKELPGKMLSLEHSSSNSIKELLHHARTAYTMLLDKTFSLHWRSKLYSFQGFYIFYSPLI